MFVSSPCSIATTIIDAITEKVTRLHELPAQAGDEIWQGHFGIQVLTQGATKGSIENGFDCLQLSSSAQE